MTRPTRAEFLNSLTCVIGGIGDQDCEAPAAPTLNAPADGSYVQSSDILTQWNAVEDPSGVTYKLCLANNGGFGGQACVTTTDTSYNVSSVITNTEGNWYWRVQATDGAGNIGDWSAASSFIIDTTDPTASLATSKNLIGGNDAIASLTGTVTDANLKHYDLSIVSADSTVVAQTAGDSTKSSEDIAYDWNVASPTILPSGVYTAMLTVTDQSGRLAQSSQTITVDNSGPDLSVSGGNTIIKGGSISPTVAAEDPRGISGYTWIADANNPAPIAFETTAQEPIFTPKFEGSYKFYVTVTDSLNNASTQTFRFDYLAELALVDKPTDTSDPTTNLATNNPAGPATVSPTSTPSRTAREELSSSIDDDSDVLGNTIAASGSAPATIDTTPVAPSEGGWKIFGMLWYWWLAIIGAVVAAWLAVKKFVVPSSQS